VELFLVHDGESALKIGSGLPVRFDGLAPAELLTQGQWAWHDTPVARSRSEVQLPPGAMTVWAFNSRSQKWGAGTIHTLEVADGKKITLALSAPRVLLSAVTFLGDGDATSPNRLVVHVANESDEPVSLRACRLWLPDSPAGYRAVRPRDWRKELECFPTSGVVPGHGKGGFTLRSGSLPLTYAVVEVWAETPGRPAVSLWAHLRVKREMFDISGGWIASALGNGNTLHAEPYLKTLCRMHINAGMHQNVPGYSDTPLFSKYPLKYMNRLQPLHEYDTEAMLPRIHAVEFLGEPQYGGGRPVPPKPSLRRSCLTGRRVCLRRSPIARNACGAITRGCPTIPTTMRIVSARRRPTHGRSTIVGAASGCAGGLRWRRSAT
jgi:hypothetical protein